MSKIIKILNRFFQGILLMAVLAGAGIWLAGKYGLINPINLFVVMSGSMEPAIQTGSVVVVKGKPMGYKVGDVITFKSSGKQTTTHRVAELIAAADGSIAYKTQGDANDTIDPKSIALTDVVGHVYLTVPKVGYAVDFAKTPQGFILLVIVPATIIIYEELKFILGELKKLISRLFKKGDKSPKSSSVLPNKVTPDAVAPVTQLSAASPVKRLNAPLPPKGHSFETFFKLPQASLGAAKQVKKKFNASRKGPNFAIIIPALAAATIFVTVSGAYLSDQEISLGNILGAAATFPQPSPTITPTPTVGPSPTPTPTPSPGVAQTLVINEVLPDSSCSVGNTEAQWLEIYNGFGIAVNLKNFKITDGTNTIDLVTANSVIVQPGSLALLSHNSAIWIQCYNDNDVVTANLGGQLDIDFGFLQLLDSTDTVIDTVQWGTAPLNPTQNQSIERTPITGFDSAFGTNFNPTDFTIKDPPTPGL